MIIEYFSRGRYGTIDKIVANTDIRHAIQLLTKRATLSDNDIKGLKLLGHECVEILASSVK